MRRAMASLHLEAEDDEDYYDDYGYSEDENGDPYAHQGPLGPGVELAPVSVELCSPELSLPEEVCAICLEQIPFEDLAIVKGCEHQYCVHCILQWASCREVPACPQCKAPFNYLYCHRLLDGTLCDAPVEESVCLLKRATWFVDHVKTQERGKAISASMAQAGETPAEWGNGDFDDYDELEADEELEAYFFSSAAGRARVIIGNRRGGENGYMRAGRMYARPAAPTPTPNSGAKQKAKAVQAKAHSGSGSAHQKTSGPGNSRSTGQGSSSGAGGTGSSGAGASNASSSAALPTTQGKNGPGRRARRKAHREAADAALSVC